MIESGRKPSLERRPLPQLLSELRKVLQRYNREDDIAREQTFAQHIMPRLEILRRKGVPLTVQRELHTVLTEFAANFSAGGDLVDALEYAELGSLLQPPAAPEPELTDEAFEHLPTQEAMRPKIDEAEMKDHTRQSQDKRSRQRVRRRWEEPTEAVILEVPIPQPRPAFHEQLFGEQAGIRTVTADAIFGPTLTPEQLISRNPQLIEQRLENIQKSLSSSQLVDAVLQTINNFLHDHKADLRATESIQSAADKDYFPNDDLVDAALRRYVKAVLDWFPDVYNVSLDQKPTPDSPKRWHRQDLRWFLKDGLEKCLNVVNRIFTHQTERELGGELNRLINPLVYNHYHQKPKRDAA